MPDTPIIAPVQTDDKLKLLEEKISGAEKFLLSEITHIQKATDLAHADLVRVPTDVDKAVGGLERLHNQKFTGIEQRFVDNKLALDAALKSQQEAVSKSETATTKQIDQIAELLRSTTNGLQMQINDLKERVLRSEGSSSGKKDSWGYLIAGIMTLIAIVTFILKFGK